MHLQLHFKTIHLLKVLVYQPPYQRDDECFANVISRRISAALFILNFIYMRTYLTTNMLVFLFRSKLAI